MNCLGNYDVTLQHQQFSACHTFYVKIYRLYVLDLLVVLFTQEPIVQTHMLWFEMPQYKDEPSHWWYNQVSFVLDI